MKRTWRDVDELAGDLAGHHPDVDPLTLTLRTLKAMVLKLPEFADDPDAGSDRLLEAIQQAWYDRMQE